MTHDSIPRPATSTSWSSSCRPGSGPWLRHFFAFRDELEKLFGRLVDLVMVSALKNPYFIREVDRTREAVYAVPTLQDEVTTLLAESDLDSLDPS